MRSYRAGMPFILITVLLDMIGIGLIVPVLPGLITEMRGGSIEDGSAMYGWFIATYALMQFVFSPFMGNLSDAIGRRPVILVSLFGAGLDYVLMAVAPNLWWLFLGRIISGITAANITAVNAYIADVSKPEERAKNFGMIGACFGVGFILGPATGGLLATYGLRVPFMASAVLVLLNWLYGYFVLPESHPVERRRPLDWRRTNPFASLKALNRVPIVIGLAVTLVLASIAHQVFPSTWVLYTTDRFGWTARQSGLSLALVGLTAIVVQGGLTGFVISKIGERRAVNYGMTLSCICFALYGLANQGWMFYCIILIGAIAGVANPAIQALISHQIPLNEQGAVQGALTGLQSLTGIAGPVLWTHVFGYFISNRAPAHIPGAAFFGGAVLVAIATINAIRCLRRPEFNVAAVVSEQSSAG